MAELEFKDAGSSNIQFGSQQSRNLSIKSLDAKAYTYRITGYAEINYIKEKSNEVKSINKHVTSFEIKEMYDKADCSYCVLGLALPSNLFRSFQDDYRNSRIVLSIERFEETDKTKDRKPEKIWDKKSFYIMDMPEGAISEDNSASSPTSMTVQGESITRVNLTLIDEKSFEINKKLFNTVIKDATVGDAIQYAVSKSFEDKNITIGKPSNTTKYEQILIPPMNFPELIRYLDTFYGVYKNGLIYFVSVSNLIICDKAEGATSKKDPINDIIVVFRNGATSGPDSGMYESTLIKDSKIIMYSDTRPNIAIRDVALKEIQGENITVTNYNDDTYELQGGGGVKSNMPSKERYFWSGSSRKDLGSALSMEINESVEVINGLIENSDFMLFDIAKKVKVEFDYDVNRDYTGQYRFTASNHTFIPVEPSESANEDGKLLKLMTQFTIKRI